MVSIYHNKDGIACTKCTYYAELTEWFYPKEPPNFATLMYLVHLARNSHSTEAIIFITANESEN